MRTTLLAFLVLVLPAAAQPATASPELNGSTCSQFVETAALAALKEPTPGAQARAVAAARDELMITMFWAHGYATAKAGAPPRLDEDWLRDRIGKLVAICRTKGAGTLPIALAVSKL